MQSEDAYSNLPPAIADALERAETRYHDAIHAENPYQNLPLLISDRVLGADFSFFENTGTTPLAEDLAKSPVLIYCANARFRGMSLFISRHWLSDFATLARKLIDAETARLANIPDTESDGWDLLTYGLQIADDAYLVGFSGPDTSTITNKKLILGLLILAADAFHALGSRSRLDFDPLAIKARLEKFLPK